MPVQLIKATPALRGAVPASYVHLLYDFLHARNINAEQVLGDAAPDAGGADPGRYPVTRWRRLLERAAARLADPDLGLTLGQAIGPQHFGLMGYVLLSCKTLGAALERLYQYQRLVYDVSPMHVHVQGSDITLEWGTESGRPGRLVDETAITALAQFARNLTGSTAAIKRVHFVNPAPHDIAPYRAYFGGEVLFDQEATRVSLPSSMLQLPLRKPDAGLLAMLENQARTLMGSLPENDDLEHQVRRTVAALSREGDISLERTAKKLNMSSRTLHRRLAPCGQNFRALRDDARRRLAEEYLKTPGISIAEVALLLGYSEQSAFTRAFGRWTGQSPRQFQKASQTDKEQGYGWPRPSI